MILTLLTLTISNQRKIKMIKQVTAKQITKEVIKEMENFTHTFPGLTRAASRVAHKYRMHFTLALYKVKVENPNFYDKCYDG